jgi:hypothetical protein
MHLEKENLVVKDADSTGRSPWLQGGRPVNDLPFASNLLYFPSVAWLVVRESSCREQQGSRPTILAVSDLFILMPKRSMSTAHRIGRICQGNSTAASEENC